jgi:heterodisulfide reductase subunit C1
MSREGLDRTTNAPDAFLAENHETLGRVTAEELVAAYERIRDQDDRGSQGHTSGDSSPRETQAADQDHPAGPGPTYPNIRHLSGTPFEREKDRRETRAWAEKSEGEMQEWYEVARTKPCTWWLKNHLVARHALTGCMACGVCTALCPAAQYYEDYNPRVIVDVALSDNEARLEELLKSETLWYCGQCGSCKPKCPRENNLMGLISSLRFLAQLKGYHLFSTRGRQQYAARHLWGGNLWNRACSLYFRNVNAESHRDFGPRYAKYESEVDQQMMRVGANPDAEGQFGGRKVPPETLGELRRCVAWGGTLALWNRLEELALEEARKMGISIDEYYERVRSDG